jgi:hypothetical protein
MCWTPKYFKKYYCWYRMVVLYLYIFRLFVRVLVHVGQTWPSSLGIISTAFNCSHDTESEYIHVWLWFKSSYLYSSIWYFKKLPLFGQYCNMYCDYIYNIIKTRKRGHWRVGWHPMHIYFTNPSTEGNKQAEYK